MEVTIRKLTPALIEDYARFFDTTPHNPSGNGDKCYCITFCRDRVYQGGGQYWYATADERRTHGVARVQDGDIQGYLAYLDGEAVGWCNAGTKADYQEVFAHMRSDNIPVDECREGEKIKFIFCLAVAPKVQRTGVATQLIEYICADAAADGFDCVETHTYADFLRDGFRGVLPMYKKCGFEVYAEQGDNIIVRRATR